MEDIKMKDKRFYIETAKEILQGFNYHQIYDIIFDYVKQNPQFLNINGQVDFDIESYSLDYGISFLTTNSTYINNNNLTDKVIRDLESNKILMDMLDRDENPDIYISLQKNENLGIDGFVVVSDENNAFTFEYKDKEIQTITRKPHHSQFMKYTWKNEIQEKNDNTR